MKKILIAIMICVTTLVGCGVNNSNNNQSVQEEVYSGAPMITINDNKYFANIGQIVNELPEGYVEMGELTNEQLKYANIIGNKYYANPKREDLYDFYVYQECGTPISDTEVDNTKRQWAYVLWTKSSQ